MIEASFFDIIKIAGESPQVVSGDECILIGGELGAWERRYSLRYLLVIGAAFINNRKLKADRESDR